MREKDYRSLRAGGIAAVVAFLSGLIMDAMGVPEPWLPILAFSIYFTVGILVWQNDTREAEWQKKMDEKAHELEAKRLREESE